MLSEVSCDKAPSTCQDCACHVLRTAPLLVTSDAVLLPLDAVPLIPCQGNSALHKYLCVAVHRDASCRQNQGQVSAPNDCQVLPRPGRQGPRSTVDMRNRIRTLCSGARADRIRPVVVQGRMRQRQPKGVRAMGRKGDGGRISGGGVGRGGNVEVEVEGDFKLAALLILNRERNHGRTQHAAWD